MTVTGSRPTSCKMPCLTTKTKVTLGPTAGGFNKTIIRFTFPNQVSIKNVTVDKFEFMESLNFLGSNLGLWPGMGLFQMLEGALSVFVAYKVLNKINITSCCRNKSNEISNGI